MVDVWEGGKRTTLKQLHALCRLVKSSAIVPEGKIFGTEDVTLLCSGKPRDYNLNRSG